MTTQPAGNPNRIPLWIIAISLLTIAMCLVVLVWRFLPEQDVTALNEARKTSTRLKRENPIAVQPVRSVSPARQASAPVEAVAAPTELFVESTVPSGSRGTQTVVQVLPMRGLALGAKNDGGAVVGADRSGRIVGKITLTQPPPPETPFDVTDFAECAGVMTQPPTTRHYVVGTNGGLADVLVWLQPMSNQRIRLKGVTRTLAFTNCMLQPYVIALSRLDVLAVQNFDTAQHVLQIESRSGGNPANLAALAPGDRLERVEVGNYAFVQLKCGLHPWEQAYVARVEYPYFAVTDRAGEYAIGDLPPLVYRVTAIHPWTHAHGGAGAGVSKQVQVTVGASVTASFRITPVH